MNLQLRLLFHQTFGIIDAQIGNPVAEIHLVDTLYIFRQIGAVGAKLGGQVAQGDSRLSVALIVFLGPKDLSSPKNPSLSACMDQFPHSPCQLGCSKSFASA